MDPKERHDIRTDLGLTHRGLGMALGFPASQAKITSEARNLKPESPNSVRTTASESVLLRLMRDRKVTPLDAMERSDCGETRAVAEHMRSTQVQDE